MRTRRHQCALRAPFDDEELALQVDCSFLELFEALALEQLPNLLLRQVLASIN